MIASANILVNTNNVQSIGSVCCSRQKPAEKELKEFLTFLGTYALSTGFLYDNTIPRKYLDPFLEVAQRLKLDHDFRPLKTEVGDQFIDSIAESLYEATDQILDEFENPSLAWKPIPEPDVNIFFRYVWQMQQALPGHRTEIAWEAFNSDAHGGKLLLGLAAEQNDRLLTSLNITYPEKVLARHMSAMMGIFRTYYLSRKAGDEDSFFSTNPGFVKLLNQKKIKSWNHLVVSFDKSAALYTRQNDFGLPLVSMALIMRAPDNITPVELIRFTKDFAKEFNMTCIMKMLVDKYVHADSTVSLEESVNRLWEAIYRKSPKDISGSQFLQDEFKYSLFPSALTGTIGAVLADHQESPLISGLLTAGCTCITTTLFVINRYLKKRSDYMGVIENLSDYNKRSIHLVQEKIDRIWSRNN